jgi:hypothetical protein
MQLVISGSFVLPQRTVSRRCSNLIAQSRLQKQSKKHHTHHGKGINKKRSNEYLASEIGPAPAQEEQEEYEKTHPHGIAKVILDIKTALYSWLGTGIEPL